MTKEKSFFYFEVMNFLTFIFYGTACVGIIICGNCFINIWLGKEYILNQIIPLLLGILILLTGIKNNLGQFRNISGAFKQMWWRPLLGIFLNIVISIILVQFIGLPGVLLGTIFSILFTNVLVDPVIIYKYSFNNYKKPSNYYLTNFFYLIALLVVFAFDYFLCAMVPINNDILKLLFSFLVCMVSVPLFFLLVFRKKDCCRYVFNKAKSIIFHYSKKRNL